MNSLFEVHFLLLVTYLIVDCSRSLIHAHFPFHAPLSLNASSAIYTLVAHLWLVAPSLLYAHSTLLHLHINLALFAPISFSLSLINAFTHSSVSAPCSTAPPLHFSWAFISLQCVTHSSFSSLRSLMLAMLSLTPSSLPLYTLSSSSYPCHHHPHYISSYYSPSLHFFLFSFLTLSFSPLFYHTYLAPLTFGPLL